MYKNTKFLQNNFYTYEDYAICGTRGWILPESDRFGAKDKKIYAREQIRLRLSLEAAKKAGVSKFIVMIHYPPMSEENEETAFIEIFKEYSVEKVIFGHLHGPSNVRATEGVIDGIEYIMTSCDFINFDPVKIL
jgi:predicted phosphohydrolase